MQVEGRAREVVEGTGQPPHFWLELDLAKP